MAQYGSIKLILGCMYSGKTTELIREWERAQSIDIRSLVINFDEDIRYGTDDFIHSHSGKKAACIRVKKLEDVSDELIHKARNIFINEGQFFSDLVPYVQKWCENKSYHKDVVVSGLDGDFKRKKFGTILDLIPIADEVHKVKAFCSLCKDGTEALFSMRVTDEKEQKVIGSDNYIPVCRAHYLERIC